MPTRVITLTRAPYGFGFKIRDEYPSIVDYVFENSPAHFSGIKTGDILIKIDAINVLNIPYTKVVDILSRAKSPISARVYSPYTFRLPTHEPHMPHVEFSAPVHTTNQCGPFQEHTSQHPAAVMLYIGTLTVEPGFPAECTTLIEQFQLLKDGANRIVDRIQHAAHFVCLLALNSKSLKIQPLSTSRCAEYPFYCIITAGVLDDNGIFLYVITRSKLKKPLDDTLVDVKNSCHVFKTLPPEFAYHPNHLIMSSAFNIDCQCDSVTGNCSHFTSNCSDLLSGIVNLVSQSLDTSRFNLPIPEPADCYNNLVTYFPDIDIAGNSTYADTNCVKPWPIAETGVLDTPVHVSDTSVATQHPLPKTHSLDGSCSTSRTYKNYMSGTLRRSLSNVTRKWLFSKFIKAANSFRSRIFDCKRNLSIQSDVNLSGCEENMKENLEIDDVNNSTHSFEPIVWAKDFNLLLHDPIGFNVFKEFLKTEFSVENLEFWLSARNWSRNYDPTSLQNEHMQIYSTFLAPYAIKAVNVDEYAMRKVTTHLTKPCIDMFKEAENQVYALMKTDSYPRFLKSDHYWSVLNKRGPVDELHNFALQNLVQYKMKFRTLHKNSASICESLPSIYVLTET